MDCYDVVGAFMRNWDQQDETGQCSADVDAEHANYVCQLLDIPFREVNFVKEYWNQVFNDLISGYEQGGTPNPDVLCNRYIKFGSFFEYAQEKLGADAVATGHYASSSAGPYLEHLKEGEGIDLLIPRDQKKDQTLFLCQISQASLRRTMFPISEFLKSQVREMAIAAGFQRINNRKESTGICFIGKRDFCDFIREYVVNKPGNFIEKTTGKVLGMHLGIHHYTFGQRACISGLRQAYYICDIVPKTSDILVVPGSNHPALYGTNFTTGQPHWINRVPVGLGNDESPTGWRGEYRFQNVHSLSGCCVSRTSDGLAVVLEVPRRAICPQQYAVFYSGRICLGGASILKPGPSLYDQNITVCEKHFDSSVIQRDKIALQSDSY